MNSQEKKFTRIKSLRFFGYSIAILASLSIFFYSAFYSKSQKNGVAAIQKPSEENILLLQMEGLEWGAIASSGYVSMRMIADNRNTPDSVLLAMQSRMSTRGLIGLVSVCRDAGFSKEAANGKVQWFLKIVANMSAPQPQLWAEGHLGLIEPLARNFAAVIQSKDNAILWGKAIDIIYANKDMAY